MTSAIRTSTSVPMPATAYAVRGDPRGRETAADEVADSGHRGQGGFEQADNARLVPLSRGLLQRRHDRDPLDPVAGAAQHREKARDEQALWRGHAEIGDADGGRGHQDQQRRRRSRMPA